MSMSKHSKFISSGISGVLEKGLQAIQLCGSGMETYPLGEYIMQALFLQMTGFNEQKLKCILWELATDDYEFRYKFLNNKNYGECSSYNDKNKVLQSLLSSLIKQSGDFHLNKHSNEALENAKEMCNKLFIDSVLKEWFPREYRFFSDFQKEIVNPFDLSSKNLFKENSCLHKAFQKLYQHRNRCAHNTLSYQENLPAFNALCADDYKYENWFVRFFVLILIDNLFSNLYQVYESARENHV